MVDIFISILLYPLYIVMQLMQLPWVYWIIPTAALECQGYMGAPGPLPPSSHVQAQATKATVYILCVICLPCHSFLDTGVVHLINLLLISIPVFRMLESDVIAKWRIKYKSYDLRMAFREVDVKNSIQLQQARQSVVWPAFDA